MPNVLVRDVPEDVHAQLQARADERGQSLQQYLAGELRRLAERPTMDEVLARIATRRGGRIGLDQAWTRPCTTSRRIADSRRDRC